VRRFRHILLTLLIGGLVGIVGLSAPAYAAGTTLGGARKLSCTAQGQPDILWNCWYVTDSHGNFAIFGNPIGEGCQTIESGDDNAYCLVGHGYLHRLNAAGTSWAWRVYDDNCDGKGPYFDTRTPPDGCRHYVGAAVTGSQIQFHLNWGGAEDSHGVYFAAPTVVDTTIGYTQTFGWAALGNGNMVYIHKALPDWPVSYETEFQDGTADYLCKATNPIW
jgi:hypothetical protein